MRNVVVVTNVTSWVFGEKNNTLLDRPTTGYYSQLVPDRVLLSSKPEFQKNRGEIGFKEFFGIFDDFLQSGAQWRCCNTL